MGQEPIVGLPPEAVFIGIALALIIHLRSSIGASEGNDQAPTESRAIGCVMTKGRG
jgi:hypothetical protein